MALEHALECSRMDNNDQQWPIMALSQASVIFESRTHENRSGKYIQVYLEMYKLKCCVPKCEDQTSARHRFPHPVNDVHGRFTGWLELVGNKMLASLDKLAVYKNKRVCGRHFSLSQRVEGSGKLMRSALPDLYIPDIPRSICSSQDAVGLGVEKSLSGSASNMHVLADLALGFSTSNAVPAVQNGGTCSSQDAVGLGVEKSLSGSASNMDVLADLGCSTPENIPGLVDVSDAHCKGNHPPARRSLFPDEDPLHGKNRRGVLQQLGVREAAELSPKAKFLYKTNQLLKKRNYHSSKKLVSFRRRLRDADKIVNQCGRKCIASLPRTVSSFLQCQIRESSKKCKGRRYSIDDKVMALSLMKRSGRAYSFLSRMFVLPTRMTLLRFLSRLTFNTGINNDMFDHLSVTVRNKVKDIDRHCILMFDEVKLTPHLDFQSHLDIIEGFEDLGEGERSERFADTALVFIVRGLRRNYKQPVAYVFPSGATKAPVLARLLKSVIFRLLESGLKVCATVCDQGTNNVAAINSLCAETRRSVLRSGGEYRGDYFCVNGTEIIPLFDPPHLLKGVRNVLLHKDLQFYQDGVKKTASWRHVLQVYSIDSGRDRLLPHITDFHVIRDRIKKMKVKYCAQVFSQRFSSVMKTLSKRPIQKEVIKNGQSVLCPDIEYQAEDTGDLLKFMDHLFDSVNGRSSKPPPGKPLLCAISGTSLHMKFWSDAMKVLESMEYISEQQKKSRTPSLINWGRTIRNIRALWVRLRETGFKRLALRNLNQDPLENKFGAIRSYGFRNNSPSSASFVGAYKSLLLNDMVSAHSVGGNCEEDACEVLDNLRSYLKSSSLPSSVAPPNIGEGVGSSDAITDHQPCRITYTNSDNISFGALTAEHLLKRLGAPKCHACRSKHLNLSTSKDAESGAIASELCPSDIFCKVFSICKDLILRKLPTVAYKHGVGSYLRNQILENVNLSSIFCNEHHDSYRDRFCRYTVDFTVTMWCTIANRYLSGKYSMAHAGIDTIHKSAAQFLSSRGRKGPTPINFS